MTIKVHGHPLSPFVRKVLLTLEAKVSSTRTSWSSRAIPSPQFRAVSPLGKIPVLQHDDFRWPTPA